MTKEELNRVRDLKHLAGELEKRLRALRVAAENIVPILDGLPRSNLARSRVEGIALKTVEIERQLEETLGELTQAKSELADRIMSEVDAPEIQTLFMLRYVECCPFKEIARRMRYGLRHVFKLHERALKDGICEHIDAQKQS